MIVISTLQHQDKRICPGLVGLDDFPQRPRPKMSLFAGAFPTISDEQGPPPVRQLLNCVQNDIHPIIPATQCLMTVPIRHHRVQAARVFSRNAGWIGHNWIQVCTLPQDPTLLDATRSVVVPESSRHSIATFQWLWVPHRLLLPWHQHVDLTGKHQCTPSHTQCRVSTLPCPRWHLPVAPILLSWDTVATRVTPRQRHGLENPIFPQCTELARVVFVGPATWPGDAVVLLQASLRLQEHPKGVPRPQNCLSSDQFQTVEREDEGEPVAANG